MTFPLASTTKAGAQSYSLAKKAWSLFPSNIPSIPLNHFLSLFLSKFLKTSSLPYRFTCELWKDLRDIVCMCKWLTVCRAVLHIFNAYDSPAVLKCSFLCSSSGVVWGSVPLQVPRWCWCGWAVDLTLSSVLGKHPVLLLCFSFTVIGLLPLTLWHQMYGFSPHRAILWDPSWVSYSLTRF